MITLQTIKDIITREVAPLRARLRGLAVRGLVRVLDDSAGLQRVQVSCTADEVSDDVEVVTPPGITARPASAEALVISVGGNPQHRLALLFDRTTRYKGELAVGEVALHMGHGDQLVLLKANGDVVITPATGRNVYLGDDGATKRVALADEVDARFATIKTLYNTHTHAGVTVGPGSTGTTPSVIGTLAPTNSSNVYAKG